MKPVTPSYSPVWLQSAVLGSLWAASEIILGSFFHNLHIPMRSMILASVGVSLMVAVGKQWPSRGLFWRAGLICALMKSVSPSGVILSPMVAIFAQGCLMELAVRIGGRRLPAFIAGGVLALCWNLLQYILYHILIYGFDIIGIYQKLYKMAAEVMPLPEDQFWLPVFVSLGLHILFGLSAALFGFFLSDYHGKPLPDHEKAGTADVQKLINRRPIAGDKSLWWLAVNFILLCGYLISASIVPFPWDLVIALPVLLFWFIRYRRSLRILRKPGFWLVFFAITLISAVVAHIFQEKTREFYQLENLWADAEILQIESED